MTEQELANIRERLEITKTFGPPVDGNVNGFDWYARDVALMLAELGLLQRRLFAAEQDCAHWKEQGEDQDTKIVALRRKCEAVENMPDMHILAHGGDDWARYKVQLTSRKQLRLVVGCSFGKTPWEALGLRLPEEVGDA